jgi:hypothetical protein
MLRSSVDQARLLINVFASVLCTPSTVLTANALKSVVSEWWLVRVHIETLVFGYRG